MLILADVTAATRQARGHVESAAIFIRAARPSLPVFVALIVFVMPAIGLAAVPTAVDVYAATQKNTSASPQSALVILEGADIDADALNYRVMSLPANGNLSDPDPSSGPFSIELDLAGQSVTYTPNVGFTGTDTFTYRVNDAIADSTIQTATITVFDGYRESQHQMGNDIDGEAEDDFSGRGLSMSSDGLTVAIGASRNDGTDVDAGHVRVYQWHAGAGAWQQLGLDIDGEAAGDFSGGSVSLSSDGLTVAIGAFRNDGTGVRAGHVRVYQWNAVTTTWQKLGLDIDGEADFDGSGISVSLSSDGLTVAIGAFDNKGGTAGGAGHVRVYQWNAGADAWQQLGPDIDGEAMSDSSGSVSLSSDGQTVAIGAAVNKGELGQEKGHVRVYQWNADADEWQQLGLDIDGEADFDASGESVSLSSDGQTVAIGAVYNSENLGHVRVYQWNAGADAWQQLGLDIDGEAANDLSGGSVSLSSDGLTVAIGAAVNKGELGQEKGHVRVYQWNADADAWQQLGLDIDGEAAGDWSGISVSLSSDGQMLAIGAIFNDGTDVDAGHVRVYALTNQPSVFGGDTAGAGSEDGDAITGVVTAIDPNGLADGHPYSVTVGPVNGVATVEPDGSWSYTPNPNFNGIDSFTITVTDALGDTIAQVITVTVTGANDAPTAVDVFAAAKKNASGLVVLEGADIDADALNYRVMSLPANGNLSDPDPSSGPFSIELDLAGQSVTYTPNVGFTGTDTFTYRVNDAIADSTIQTATITVFDGYRESQHQMGNDIDGEAEDDFSGRGLSMSSDGLTVAIGASRNDGTDVDAGHVRVYQWHAGAGAWQQLGLDIDGEAAGDFSGGSVSLSSDGLTVAIGAFRNDGTGVRAGHVRVYQWNAVTTTWQKLGLDIDGEADFDGSGISVSLSSDGLTVAIGAFDNKGGTAGGAGHVRVYQWNAGADAWQQLGPDIDGEAMSDSSGSVSLSSDGQTVAIGAAVNKGELGQEKGHVRVYQWNADADEWQQLGLDIDGEADFDASGESVSLSSDGQTVAIGAVYNSENLGHVRVYQWNAGADAWQQLGLDIDGEAAGDSSGISVSLSSDGLTVAIGAYGNDGTDVDAGHVRVYQWNAGADAWQQLGLDIDGEAASDSSGISVSLSSDGQMLAIGAIFNDGTDVDAGHVRMYALTNQPSVFGGDTAGAGSEDGDAITGVVTVIDPNGLADSHPYSVTVGPVKGVATVEADGSWSYIPNPNFNGIDSFTITVTDALGDTIAQVITVTVTGANDAPTAVDVFAAAKKNASGLVVLEGADIDADTLTYSIVSGPAEGVLTDPDNGDAPVTTGAITSQRVTYTPNPGYTGIDTFTYTVNDGDLESKARTATVSVFDDYRSTQRQIGLNIYGEAAEDRSGVSASLSSDGLTVAIGAYLNDGNGTNAGHVRVYRYTGGAWVQRGDDIDGEAAGDYSALSLSLSSDGQTLAIAAIFNDDDTVTGAGHVRVYRWHGGGWDKLGTDINGEAKDDQSGWSVSLASDGRTVAIGAHRNDGEDPNSLRGHVRVYHWNGYINVWQQLGFDIDGEAAVDFSGSSVSLSSDGQTLAVGAIYNDDNGTSAGHVRVYRWSGSAWVQRGVDIDGEAANDRAGQSVALSSDGQTLAIGANLNDGNGLDAGHVRVYQWSGNAWVQLGADIDGEAASDESGRSVSLSSDGLTVAIGGPGFTGNDAIPGQARVYQWNGSGWFQLGVDIAGEKLGDLSGWSVSLSGDGQYLAVGAPLNDRYGSDAGTVRIFRLVNLAPSISGAAPTSINTGEKFSFVPLAAGADGDAFTFSISTQPAWAMFNTQTGALTGEPGAAFAGTITSGILITVTDEDGLTTVLPAFDLEVLAMVPSAPQVVNTDYGDGKIYLSVSVSDNGGSPVTQYNASCSDGANTVTGTSTTSSITVTGLTNGTAYTCTVSTTNSAGTGAVSALSEPIMPEQLVRGVPIWLLKAAMDRANDG
jgi:VCBS repeat-containing protein